MNEELKEYLDNNTREIEVAIIISYFSLMIVMILGFLSVSR